MRDGAGDSRVCDVHRPDCEQYYRYARFHGVSGIQIQAPRPRSRWPRAPRPRVWYLVAAGAPTACLPTVCACSTRGRLLWSRWFFSLETPRQVKLVCDQACPDWIRTNISPAFVLLFSVSKTVIEISGLPSYSVALRNETLPASNDRAHFFVPRKRQHGVAVSRHDQEQAAIPDPSKMVFFCFLENRPCNDTTATDKFTAIHGAYPDVKAGTVLDPGGDIVMKASGKRHGALPGENAVPRRVRDL